MTDNEIIKALEGCGNWESDKTCDECPANTYGFGCAHKMAKHSLDLINRQKTEIERLKCALHKYIDKDDIKEIEMYEALAETRVNAIKEFAERLTNRICENVNRSLDNPDGNNYYPIDVYKDIDNLVKEMT